MERKFKAIFISCLAFLLVGMPVSADSTDTTTASVTVTGGFLSLTSPSETVEFDSIVIDGTNKTIEEDLGIMAVEDFTGSGNGWSVTVSALQFTSGSDTIPNNSLSLVGVLGITADNTPSGLPTQVGTGPYTLDSGSAATILTATAGNGMGKFNVAFATKALKLTVNSSILRASATPYTSTITYTIVTGP